jgi:hypothetical protein
MHMLASVSFSCRFNSVLVSLWEKALIHTPFS